MLRTRAMSLPIWSLALTLVVLAEVGSAQVIPAPVSRGDLLISEVHHPAQTTVPTPVPFRYIEIMTRRQLTTPRALGGGSLVVVTPGAVNPVVNQLVFPPGTFIPEPEIDPLTGALIPGVLVITQQPIANLGPSPLGIPRQLVAPSLFTPTTGAPGLDLRILLSGPPDVGGTLGAGDELVIGVSPGGPPTIFGAQGTPPVDRSTGHVNRVLYVRSDTLFDYETVTGVNSPGLPNPRLDHLGGFRMGGGPNGVPFGLTSITPTNFVGALNVGGAPLGAILAPLHPQFPEIGDPRFDRSLLVGSVVGTTNITVTSPQLANPSAPGGFNWSLIVPPQVSTNPGVLQINQGSLVQAAVELIPNSGLPGGMPFLVQRFLTDNNPTDAIISGSGELTEVQIDILGTAGDLWCEMIVYDGGGYAYKAKVRNWPDDPQNCTTPRIGLGTDGAGSLCLVTLCFSPQAEMYILPSLVPAPVTGTGAFLGLNLDGFTLFGLSQPLGVEPFHVTADNDGLYFYGAPFALPLGLSMDWVAAEYTPGLGFTQVAPAETITL